MARVTPHAISFDLPELDTLLSAAKAHMSEVLAELPAGALKSVNFCTEGGGTVVRCCGGSIRVDKTVVGLEDRMAEDVGTKAVVDRAVAVLQSILSDFSAHVVAGLVAGLGAASLDLLDHSLDDVQFRFVPKGACTGDHSDIQILPCWKISRDAIDAGKCGLCAISLLEPVDTQDGGGGGGGGARVHLARLICPPCQRGEGGTSHRPTIGTVRIPFGVEGEHTLRYDDDTTGSGIIFVTKNSKWRKKNDADGVLVVAAKRKGAGLRYSAALPLQSEANAGHRGIMCTFHPATTVHRTYPGPVDRLAAEIPVRVGISKTRAAASVPAAPPAGRADKRRRPDSTNKSTVRNRAWLKNKTPAELAVYKEQRRISQNKRRQQKKDEMIARLALAR